MSRRLTTFLGGKSIRDTVWPLKSKKHEDRDDYVFVTAINCSVTWSHRRKKRITAATCPLLTSKSMQQPAAISAIFCKRYWPSSGAELLISKLGATGRACTSQSKSAPHPMTWPTDILPSILPQQTTGSYCLSDKYYTTSASDTCHTIASAYNVSSAALYKANSNSTIAVNCASVTYGTTFCLPPPCEVVYTIQPNDTCTSIEQSFSLAPGTVRDLNAWIQYACTNFQITNAIYVATWYAWLRWEVRSFPQ